MIHFAELSLSFNQFALLALATFIFGVNKGGVHGIVLIGIPIFIAVLGAKVAAVYVALLFTVGDAIAFIRYHKNINFTTLCCLLPTALAGVITATVIGPYMSDQIFELLITSTILLCLALMIWPTITQHLTPRVGYFFGFLGGFNSMVGNTAGPVLTAYLSNQNLSRASYLSTFTAFFCAMNIVKMLLHFFFWKSLTKEVVLVDLALTPFLLLGLGSGFFLVKHLNDRAYRRVLIGGVLLACMKLAIDAFI